MRHDQRNEGTGHGRAALHAWARHAAASSGFGDAGVDDARVGDAGLGSLDCPDTITVRGDPLARMADPGRRAGGPRRQFFEPAVGRRLTRLVASATRRLSAALSAWRRQRRADATRTALGSLDDRALRDLGFDRSEITSVAAGVGGHGDPTRVRMSQALQVFVV